LGFFLFAGRDHIVGAGTSVFAASIEVDMKRSVHLIGDYLMSQTSCPKARKISVVLDTHQDIIGHDAPVWSRLLPDHNEHSAFEGHEKEDVTNKVSDPLFTNLVQRSENNKKTHAH